MKDHSSNGLFCIYNKSLESLILIAPYKSSIYLHSFLISQISQNKSQKLKFDILTF